MARKEPPIECSLLRRVSDNSDNNKRMRQGSVVAPRHSVGFNPVDVLMSESSNEHLIKVPDLPIRLPVFEGPLDLLLFLIRRNELDIYDIPILQVTEQYMEIIRRMKQKDLEVAGEFFVMASTLMYIKSRMLLPRDEQGDVDDAAEDESIDPRWELVQQLIEYRKFKESAATLDDMIHEAQMIIAREVQYDESDPTEERPLTQTDRIAVWGMFNQVLKRLSERMVVGEIHDEVVTVSDRMEYIMTVLETRSRFNFTDLFEQKITVSYLISTFIALLELTRLNKITIDQSTPFGDIECSRLESDDHQRPHIEYGTD